MSNYAVFVLGSCTAATARAMLLPSDQPTFCMTFLPLASIVSSMCCGGSP